MNNSVFTLSDISYLVSVCTEAKVGDKQKHPEVTFGWHTNEQKRFINWHFHRFWIVKKGGAHVKTTFGNFDLVENKVYYIPPCSILESNCPDYMEQFYIDFIPESIYLSINDFFDFGYESDEYDLILLLMSKIRDNYKKNDADSVFLTNTAMSAILACFFHGLKKNKPQINNFLEVLNYINDNYTSKITLQELSDLAGYTPEHFSVLFKNAFGLSPKQFIIRKRLSLAKTYLLTTQKSISEIATICGYPDQLYFCRIFHTTMGISPSSFRKDSIEL